MKSVNQMFDNTVSTLRNRQPKQGRGLPFRIMLLAVCSALALPGIALAKKPVASTAGCVILPPAYIDTGYPYKVKIVRDPSYTGVWSQPTVEVTAVVTLSNGGKSVDSRSTTISKYGVTYVNVSLLAPENCDPDGTCGLVNSSVDAVITATVKEPINKGKRVRETVCTPATASVNPAM